MVAQMLPNQLIQLLEDIVIDFLKDLCFQLTEEVSIRIMAAFVAMRRYIENNEYRISHIESKIIGDDKI